jgi:hypothetical protein
VKDPDVRPGDPRTQFTLDKDGKRQPPQATEFYDFVVILWPSREVIAVSFKSTGIGVAKDLNSFLKQSKGPIWSKIYTVTVIQQENKKGRFFNFKVVPAGYLSKPEFLQYAEQTFENVKDKKFDIDRGDTDVSDADESQAPANADAGFEPSRM